MIKNFSKFSSSKVGGKFLFVQMLKAAAVPTKIWILYKRVGSVGLFVCTKWKFSPPKLGGSKDLETLHGSEINLC